MKSIERFNEVFGNQFGNPRGLLGMYTSEKMVKQHVIETQWTIKLLNIQHNETILDLGCGAGYAMKLLLEQPAVRHVVGLDLSKSILRSATIRNRNEISKGRVIFVLYYFF
ncbi:class I SAM-dependent methyltransferase [Clostridium sp.]